MCIPKRAESADLKNRLEILTHKLGIPKRAKSADLNNKLEMLTTDFSDSYTVFYR